MDSEQRAQLAEDAVWLKEIIWLASPGALHAPLLRIATRIEAALAEPNNLAPTKSGTQPQQPVVLVDGIARFKENAIIRFLVNYAGGKGCSLNELALMSFTNEDRNQLAQLIGYSVSGFGDLSYADPAIVAAADAEVKRMVAQAAPPAPPDVDPRESATEPPRASGSHPTAEEWATAYEIGNRASLPCVNPDNTGVPCHMRRQDWGGITCAYCARRMRVIADIATALQSHAAAQVQAERERCATLVQESYYDHTCPAGEACGACLVNSLATTLRASAPGGA